MPRAAVKQIRRESFVTEAALQRSTVTITLYPTSRLWKPISGFSGMSYVKVRYGYVRYPIEKEWLRPDTKTQRLTETALSWLHRKSKKTCCPRTSAGNVTCRVDRGADSSLRESGTSTTKQKRVRGSFKPSTQYAAPRRRDPPEDLVGRKLDESLLGGSSRGTTEWAQLMVRKVRVQMPQDDPEVARWTRSS